MTENRSFAADPATIVALTVAVLGIDPRESLVLVGLGAQGRVIVALRHDVTADPVLQTEQGQRMAALLARNDAAAALVLTFCADRMTAYTHRGAVEASLSAAGIGVARSLQVDDVQILDEDGQAWALPSAEQAEALRRRIGAQAPVSRAEKIAAVAPVEAHAVTQQIARAEIQTADPATAAVDLDALCARYLATGQLSDREIARYAIATSQVGYRDALCAAVAAEDAMPNTAEVLVYLAARVPRGYRGEAYTVAALALYIGGSAIEARAALDHALEADRSHTLALLITASLDGGVPPQVIREMIATSSDE